MIVLRDKFAKIRLMGSAAKTKKKSSKTSGIRKIERTNLMKKITKKYKIFQNFDTVAS